MLNGLTAVLGATENKSVATGRSAKSKLIERNGFTTSGNNAGTGGSSESEGSDSHLGASEQAVVVGDGANNDNGALLAFLVDVRDDAGQGDGRAVDLGHKETSKNDLVERGIGSAWEEFINFCVLP